MRSIRTKLAILVATAVISAVAIASMLSAWHDASRRFSAKRLELQGVAATIATSLAHPLSQNDTNNVARTLGAVGRIPGLTFARVTDTAGRTIHQYGFGVVVARESGPMVANADIGPFSILHLETYPVEAPIISGGERIGQITLIADLSSLRGAVLESLFWAVLVGTVAVLVGLLISWRMQRSIAGPVALLTTAMQEVSRTKDFSRHVEVATNDEIGILVRSFNGMLDEVRARDEALARHRDRLEVEVVNRTVDLVKARQEAEAANAAKSDFLATMSHEIRTPMNGMLVMAELMATSSLPPRIQRYADVLVNSGKSLLAIINDILDFSKIEAGKLELERVPVGMRAVIDDVLELFHERALAQGLEFAAHVASSVPLAITADPVRLTQVLSNLVNNALKFTQSGHVSIRVSFVSAGQPADGILRIDVSDTGIGIPSEKLTQIFDAFAQADQSTTRRFGGTGIGLSICRRLTHAMGGDIGVSSEVGRGSTFSVTLPVVVLKPAPAPLAIAPGADKRVVTCLGPAKPLTLEVLHAYLAERGFDAIEVEPGELTTSTGAPTVAVIAPGDVIDKLAASGAHGETGAHRVILVALSPLRGLVGTDLVGTTAADMVLNQPLASAEITACLDALVRGREAVVALAAETRSKLPGNAAPFADAGIRILTADDNAVNREVLSEALGRLGIEVVSVEDGAAALAAVTAQPFDLLFVDWNMPVMDGPTAAREIRKWEAATGRTPIPIVALTAHAVGPQTEAWRDAGMSDYMTKPYTLASLQACLEKALGARLSQQPAIVPERNLQTQRTAKSSRLMTLGATVATPISPDTLLDMTILRGICEMRRPGDDLVGRIVQLYADHAPRALAALVRAKDSSDADAVAEAAHALRSQSLNMGAARVARLCEGLENRARCGDISGAPETCSAIGEALEATITALNAEVAPMNAPTAINMDLRKAS